MIELLDWFFIWSGRIFLILLVWAIILQLLDWNIRRWKTFENMVQFIFANQDEWIKFLKIKEFE